MNMAILDSKKKSCGCICGNDMIHKVGTITRVIRGQEIRIHQVPYSECPECGEIVFDLSLNISSMLANAYKHGISDVVYNPDQNSAI